jgi:hypothetical protein
MSASIPFERYDEEFLSLTEQVTSKLRPLDPSTAKSPSLPPTAEADVKMAHNLLLQADDLLKQMGLEARGEDDPSVKRDLLAKVREILLLVFSVVFYYFISLWQKMAEEVTRRERVVYIFIHDYYFHHETYKIITTLFCNTATII